MTETVILLVDDEKTVLDSLGTQLSHLFGDAYEYETAESAEEAWEVLRELHQDGISIVVVVSDWLMPGQRGDAFLTELRGEFPGIGRILLTGQADADALERAWQDARVHGVLFKPWRPDDLRAAITRAISATH
jgi:CheY-like chemotaxis protein